MWYNKVFSDLRVSESVFRHLAKSNLSLVFDLVKEDVKFIYVQDKDMPFAPAAAIIEKREILLNELYFSGLAKEFVGLNLSQKLESLSWYVLHEAGHLKFTPKDWSKKMFGNKRNTYIITLGQLVEDVFIEDAIIKQNPNFEDLMYSSHEVLFNDDLIKERLSVCPIDKPTNLEEVKSLINYMICWKRYSFFELTSFQAKLYETLMKAKGCYSIEQRSSVLKELVSQIFDEKLNDEASEEQSTLNMQGGDNVKVEESKKGNEFFDQFGKMFRLGSNINGSLFNPKQNSYDIEDVELLDGSGITTAKIKPGSSIRVYVPKFLGLKDMEVGRGSVRSVKGQPRKSGNKITNIKHYESGNIFGKQFLDGYRAGEGAPELLLLVDGSGSMSEKTSISQYTSKYEAAIAQAVAVARALDGSKVSLGIYTHTCGKNPDIESTAPVSHKITNGILIEVIKGMGEKISLNEIERRSQNSIDKFSGHGNADACAIAHVSTLFKGNGDKIIVVISDGLPADYFPEIVKKYNLPPLNSIYAHERIAQTKSAVDLIRSRGIKIFSIAIDHVAIAPCEQIYGVGNSVYADDVKKFERMIISSTN